MSMILSLGSKKIGVQRDPKGLWLKTSGIGNDPVFLEDHEISLEGFAVFVCDAMTDIKLTPNDPRLELLEAVKKVDIGDGYTLMVGGKNIPTVAIKMDEWSTFDFHIQKDAAKEDFVKLLDCRITMEDFAIMVSYVLTNTNLRIGDPRLKLLATLKSMEAVGDYIVAHIPFA